MISVVLLFVLSAALILFLELSNNKESDTSQSKTTTNTTVDQSNSQNTEPAEIKYSINTGSRESPCVGTYTNGQSNIAKPWLGFVNLGSPSKSVSAQKLVTDAESKMYEYNQDYKFGDHTDAERDTYFNSVFSELQESFKKLSLEQWNSELQSEKTNFNDKIVNGNKENCFDMYIVSTNLADYVESQALKSQGL